MLSPNLKAVLAMNPVEVWLNGMFWQPFTYMFVHANMSHILFNMLVLFVFGHYLEQALGSIEFLVLYLGVGLLAGLFSLWFYLATQTYLVYLLGASGAIYGAVFVFAVLNPHARLYILGFIPISARVLVFIYAAADIFGHIGGGSGTAHMTHLAGFVIAAIYCAIRLRMNPIKRLMD